MVSSALEDCGELECVVASLECVAVVGFSSDSSRVVSSEDSGLSLGVEASVKLSAEASVIIPEAEVGFSASGVVISVVDAAV